MKRARLASVSHDDATTGASLAVRVILATVKQRIFVDGFSVNIEVFVS